MIQLPTIDTPREPVTDMYHGVEVADEYQWLENEGSEATRGGTAAQDARTRAYLEALPFRDAIRHRFEEISRSSRRRTTSCRPVARPTSPSRRSHPSSSHSFS